MQSRRNKILTTLLQRFCCFYIYVPVLLEEPNIALFAQRFSFDHIGGFTFDAVLEEQYSDPSSYDGDP